MSENEKNEASAALASGSSLVSGSQRVFDFLKTLQPGETFTSAWVHASLGNVSSVGVVTGLLSRLKAEGSIKVTGIQPNPSGKAFLEYQIVDLSRSNVKNLRSPGGKKGRSMGGVSSREQISNLLLDLASQIESLPSTLDAFSTFELLREIERRVKRQDAAGQV